MDLDAARLFLQQLDGHADPIFAFRTFQDSKTGDKNPGLTCNRYGKFDDLKDEFIRLNTMGAGIFFTLNVTDGKGYSGANIVRIRSLVVDLDGAPLEPVEKFQLKPQIIVESSNKRYHAYWLIDESTPLALPMFEPIQTAIAERFNGDKTVKDLPRVLRLPGFYHKKKEPFLTTIISTHDTPPRYKASDLLEAFGVNSKTGKQKTLPVSIPQGQRDTRLTSFAGSMRRMGASESSILEALKIENQRCMPPLEISELVRIAHSAAKYPPHHDDFIRDKHGKIYANEQNNIKTALEKMNITVTYNQFAERFLYQRDQEKPIHLNELAMKRLWLEADEAFKFRPGYDFFETVVLDLAAHKNAFHPVREYLDKLEWDQKPRLEDWLIKYAGAGDSAYTRAVGRIILIAAVRRVRQPGCKFDEMMVLESAQGTEKSTALEALCPQEDWFSDNLPLSADSKRVIEQTRGKWILEAAELSGMRKSDIEHLKAFLSRRVDIARMSYDRMMTERPRNFIVIGTTNSNQYLKDSTGNRRYWPVRITKFNVGELRRDRNQLWAEASKLEAEGASIRLDPSLWNQAEVQQERRRLEDPWEIRLAQVLGDCRGKILTDDIWAIVGMDQIAKRTQIDFVRLSDALRRLDFNRINIRDGKVVKHGYIRSYNEEDKDFRIKIEVEDNELRAISVPRGVANNTAEWEQPVPTQ